MIFAQGDVTEPQRKPTRQSFTPWFWSGFLGVLLFGLILTLFAALRSGGERFRDLPSDPIPPPLTEIVRIVIAPGESVAADAAALAKARLHITAVLARRTEQARTKMIGIIEADLQSAFAGIETYLPDFVDWYYSLSGEYMRLFYGLVHGQIETLLEEKFSELVFTPADAAARVANLESRLGEQAVTEVQSIATDTVHELRQFLRRGHVATQAVEAIDALDVGEALSLKLEPYFALKPSDIVRQGMAATAGVAAAGVTAKKLAGTAIAKGAGKSAIAAASAVGGKAGLKAAGSVMGSAGAGAAAGATICSGTVVGLPVTPLCAAIGGAATALATWLVVDKAALAVDEYLHREEFERSLHNALAEEEHYLTGALEARYVAGTAAYLNALQSEIEALLVPPPTIAPKRDFDPIRRLLENGDAP